MLSFLRWASLSYGLPPLHFTRHSDLLRVSLMILEPNFELGVSASHLHERLICSRRQECLKLQLMISCFSYTISGALNDSQVFLIGDGKSPSINSTAAKADSGFG